jgi:hypothetical protein
LADIDEAVRLFARCLDEVVPGSPHV